MSGGWRAAPLELDVDLAHGGRWTSLRSAGREWLWTHRDPEVAERRRAVTPGAAFVDAGGVEECVPTVRGVPDHGDAWSRPWTGSADDASVRLDGGIGLRRRTGTDDSGAVLVAHELSGPPGERLVHAVHALLDVGPTARLVVPGARTMLVLDDDGATREGRWPSGLDLLGPDDATATCVIVPRSREATVVDGDHALRLVWDCPAQPDLCSLMLWRNLGGWPAPDPYRSIGVEPMLGRTAERVADDGVGCAELDASGRLRWTLRLTAGVRGASAPPARRRVTGSVHRPPALGHSIG